MPFENSVAPSLTLRDIRYAGDTALHELTAPSFTLSQNLSRLNDDNANTSSATESITSWTFWHVSAMKFARPCIASIKPLIFPRALHRDRCSPH
ncbi:hypothetical protein CEXT_719141 [Caerostris extrusa]|uniref:Uncharacterized protein n=1 Tax=Caerostris extrusa TaxID=172846 RepID=A0AAV4U411_CAEEX|nr:hypothetical protein CEXT_719141 [Caerostris extrusa]